MSKLVYGVGVNDATYQIYTYENGKRVCCKFYSTWLSMLSRCYSPNFHSRYPTYIGCTVCDDWLTFSNFKSWMDHQDWNGKQLDKDIISAGNKVYCPDFCAFVDCATNNFMTNSGQNGCDLYGVSFDKRVSKYKAEIRNSTTKKREHLGVFACIKDAHMAWRMRKHQLACQLAELQTDQRVAKALRTIYL